MKEMAKTIVPIVLGAIAGIFSMLITQDVRNRDAFGIIVLVIFIYAQKFIFPKIGIKVEAKDWLAISFLSLASWYLCWTLLINF
ncbi:MAG: hypothetical protein ACK401_05385 [Archaeoglobaceae archaeon]